MSDRLEKIGQNEALFRLVNEEIHAVTGEDAEQPSEMSILCECGSSDCITELPIRLDDYEALRADSDLFAVVPGHGEAQVEDVLEHRDAYDLVRKHSGPAAKLAEVTDPRRS